MRTKIITSGYKFIDIDALACIFAYQELLALKNEKSEMVVTADFNSSIVKRYRNLISIKKTSDFKNKEFVIMDFSDPEYFEKFVDIDSV